MTKFFIELAKFSGGKTTLATCETKEEGHKLGEELSKEYRKEGLVSLCSKTVDENGDPINNVSAFYEVW